MAYMRQQGVDTCIARIFNSIVAHEQVLYDDGRELRRESAEELAMRLAPSAVTASYAPRSLDPDPDRFSDAIEYPLDGFRVPAFTTGGRLLAAPTNALIAHP